MFKIRNRKLKPLKIKFIQGHHNCQPQSDYDPSSTNFNFVIMRKKIIKAKIKNRIYFSHYKIYRAHQ